MKKAFDESHKTIYREGGETEAETGADTDTDRDRRGRARFREKGRRGIES